MIDEALYLCICSGSKTEYKKNSLLGTGGFAKVIFYPHIMSLNHLFIYLSYS